MPQQVNLAEKYTANGAKAFLPKALSNEELATALEIITKLEQGIASLPEAEKIGFMTLAVKSITLNESKPILEQLDQTKLYMYMNRYADELILEDLYRRELIDLVQCTEPDTFYSETRPTVLKIINDDHWPEKEHEFREQLRSASVTVNVTKSGEVSINKQ